VHFLALFLNKYVQIKAGEYKLYFYLIDQFWSFF